MQITSKSEVFEEEEEEKQVKKDFLIMKPDKDLNINKSTRHKLKR